VTFCVLFSRRGLDRLILLYIYICPIECLQLSVVPVYM
jgi:hypothetical protein